MIKLLEYNCMITEYFYWGLLTELKVDLETAENTDLINEWKILKNDGSLDVKTERLRIYELLTNNKYLIPKNLPKGEYEIRDDWYGKGYIETQYEKAYNLIYSTWKKN